MKDKAAYDKKRHFDISFEGQKVKILNYRFVTAPNGEKRLILKTKIRGTVLDHLDFRTPYSIEIPTENCILTVVGEYIGGIPGEPEFEIINII